jgi:tetratricopeptide (TPR) repeat protein
MDRAHRKELLTKPEHLEIEIRELMGIAFIKKGEYHSALSCFYDSLELAEQIEYNVGVADASLNIGTTYRFFNDFHRALEFYKRALILSRQENFTPSLGKSLVYIARIYYFQKKYEQAMEYFNEALKTFVETDNKPGIGRTLISIGDIHRRTRSPDRAKKNYLQAVEVLEIVEDDYNLGLSLANLGLLAFKLGKNKGGIEYFKNAFDRFRDAEAYEEIILYNQHLKSQYDVDFTNLLPK